jgi:hypothetical protein
VFIASGGNLWRQVRRRSPHSLSCTIAILPNKILAAEPRSHSLSRKPSRRDRQSQQPPWHARRLRRHAQSYEVRTILSRFCDPRRTDIKRNCRNQCDYPAQDPRIGVLSPSTDAVAQALKGRDAARLQPTGAYAANILGLSDQVPARTVFLTDGRSRRVRIGKQEIIIRHTTLRNMATAGTTSGMAIQALRWIGRHHVDDQTCALLAKRLTDADKRKLIEDARYAPAWVAAIMHRVAEAGKDCELQPFITPTCRGGGGHCAINI